MSHGNASTYVRSASATPQSLAFNRRLCLWFLRISPLFAMTFTSAYTVCPSWEWPEPNQPESKHSLRSVVQTECIVNDTSSRYYHRKRRRERLRSKTVCRSAHISVRRSYRTDNFQFTYGGRGLLTGMIEEALDVPHSFGCGMVRMLMRPHRHPGLVGRR